MTGSEAQALFDEGVKLLSETRYPEAKEKFIAVQKANFASADLDANLGRALVESGETGPGIYHLQKAIGQERFDSLHRNDLRFAQAKVESAWGLPMKHPAEWGEQISTYLRAPESFATSTFLILLFAALRFLRMGRGYVRALLVAGAVVFVLFGALSLYGRSLGTLVQDSELRSAPLASAEVTQALKSGVRLRVVRQSGDFSEVERTGAFRGWVFTRDLAKSPF